ncbi:MAG: GTPase Era [Candidatus Omnitrophica bacterium]|nr:GTPase Era [Candidatus Omnitrophota bacterium]
MEKVDFRTGFVAILGRPNVGKSTLLNKVIENKISIISPIPQTTRHQIRGILNLKDAQIVFVDTPGIHSFKDNLSAHLNTIAKKTLSGCDLILYVVDTSRGIGKEEEVITNILVTQEIKTIMVLNKIDLGEKFLNDYINFWEAKKNEKQIKESPLIYYLPLSAKTGKNIDNLKDLIVDNLPAGHPFYDTDTITDFPLKFRISDIVREKLFLQLRNELPHSLAVEVEDIQEKETRRKEAITHIKVNIYVSRESQRKIVIGKAGAILKETGSASRQEIEKIVGRKVFLNIKVLVLKGWQESPRILKELGYWKA